MQPEFDLSGEGCYEDPKVKEEDDVFQDALDTLNKYTQMKITYQAEGKDDVVWMEKPSVPGFLWMMISMCL